MDGEEWRPVVGWEELYEVSSLGRLRSKDRVTMVMRYGKSVPARYKGQLIVGCLDSKGYQSAGLYRDGIGTTFRLHRLVCAAFHGAPPQPSMDAAHNDGDRRNNDYRNLRWATRRENLADCVEHDTRPRGERQGSHKLTTAQVLEIRAQPNADRGMLSAHYGVTRNTICRILNRKRWAHI